MKTKLNLWFLLPVLSLAAFLGTSLSSCGKAGSTSQVNLQFGQYTAWMRIYDLLIPRAEAAVGTLNICFKRVRLKAADESTSSDTSTDPDNDDVSNIGVRGEVSFSSTVTSFGSVSTAPKQVRRVEFDLDNHCPNGYTAQLVNASGTFTTSDSIEIKFEGLSDFDATSSGGTLSLEMQSIIDALNTVSSNAALSTALQSSGGKF